MESKCSNFWMGLGIGSILGVIVYRCCQSSKVKQLKGKISHAFHVAADQTENFVGAAEEKVKDVGATISDTAYNVAEKADEMKNKAHNFTDNVSK